LNIQNHAVTLFEVGKLADETVDNFVEELQNVNFFVEGEAQRYSEHARTLLNTIQSLRTSNELDLIRGESLLNLDPNARVKVLQKSYKLLVSMSPISAEACTLPISTLPYYGTPCVELTSYWLKLLLYDLVGNGPPSMLLPMGSRVQRIPELFWNYERVVLSTGKKGAKEIIFRKFEPPLVFWQNLEEILNFKTSNAIRLRSMRRVKRGIYQS
jgi:hypothetical protein